MAEVPSAGIPCQPFGEQEFSTWPGQALPALLPTTRPNILRLLYFSAKAKMLLPDATATYWRPFSM